MPTPTISTGAEYPVSLTSSLTYTAGTLTNAPMVQTYLYDLTDQSGAVVTSLPSNPEQLRVNFLDTPAATVSIPDGHGGTITLTYAQLLLATATALADQRAAQLAAYSGPTPKKP